MASNTNAKEDSSPIFLPLTYTEIKIRALQETINEIKAKQQEATAALPETPKQIAERKRALKRALGMQVVKEAKMNNKKESVKPSGAGGDHPTKTTTYTSPIEPYVPQKSNEQEQAELLDSIRHLLKNSIEEPVNPAGEKVKPAGEKVKPAGEKVKPAQENFDLAASNRKLAIELNDRVLNPHVPEAVRAFAAKKAGLTFPCEPGPTRFPNFNPSVPTAEDEKPSPSWAKPMITPQMVADLDREMDKNKKADLEWALKTLNVCGDGFLDSDVEEDEEDGEKEKKKKKCRGGKKGQGKK